MLTALRVALIVNTLAAPPVQGPLRAPKAEDPQTGPLVADFFSRGRVALEFGIRDPMQNRSDIEDGTGPACQFVIRMYDETLLDAVELLHDSPSSGRLWVTSSHRITLGRMADGSGDSDLPVPGADVTGDGLPDLVLTTSTGGAHCCAMLEILQLRPTFRHVQSIDLQDYRAKFVQLDKDPDLEIEFADHVFHNFYTGNADSPAPRVVLKWTDDQYLTNPALMRADPMPKAQLEALAARLRAIKNPSATFPPSELARAMADLLYTGNMAQAWWLLDHGWDVDAGVRATYARQFRDQVAKSDYQFALCQLNRDLEWLLVLDRAEDARHERTREDVIERRAEVARSHAADDARHEQDADDFVGSGRMIHEAWLPKPAVLACEEDEWKNADVFARVYARTIDEMGVEIIRAGVRTFAMTTGRIEIQDRLPVPWAMEARSSWEKGVFPSAPELPIDPDFRPIPQSDVTGDGFPDLVVWDRMLGCNHCLMTCRIFEFWPEFRAVPPVRVMDTDWNTFAQLDADPKIELRSRDDNYSSWRCCGADSPAPDVILKFDGTRMALATALMRRPPLADAVVDDMVAACLANPEWRNLSDPTRPPVAFWVPMLDMIYAGNPEQAEVYGERAWPKGVPGHAQFLADFHDKVAQSEFADDLPRIAAEPIRTNPLPATQEARFPDPQGKRPDRVVRIRPEPGGTCNGQVEVMEGDRLVATWVTRNPSLMTGSGTSGALADSHVLIATNGGGLQRTDFERFAVWPRFTSLGTFHQDNPIEPEAQDADDEAGEAPQPLGMAPAN